MGSGSKIGIGAAVIIVAIILQVGLIAIDRQSNPGAAAVDFTKAYYSLDADMADSGNWQHAAEQNADSG